MDRIEQMQESAERYAEEVCWDSSIERKRNIVSDFAAGWKAADSSRWVSVRDGLPPKTENSDICSEWVVVSCGGKSLGVDSYNFKKKEWLVNNNRVKMWQHIELPIEED